MGKNIYFDKKTWSMKCDTVYDKDKIEQRLCTHFENNGGCDARSLCAAMQISLATYYRWLAQSDEFKSIIERFKNVYAQSMSRKFTEFADGTNEGDSKALHTLYKRACVTLTKDAADNMSVQEQLEHYKNEYLAGNMTDAQYQNVTKSLTGGEVQHLIKEATKAIADIERSQDD